MIEFTFDWYSVGMGAGGMMLWFLFAHLIRRKKKSTIKELDILTTDMNKRLQELNKDLISLRKMLV